MTRAARSHGRIIQRMRMLAALLALLLSACQPAPVVEPLPTPAALVVQATPALAAWGDRLAACVLELPNTGLVLLETPAGALDLERSALALRWGPGSEAIGYAAVIGADELVFIVHPENPLEQITLQALRDAYQGRLEAWPAPAGGALELWAYPPGDDVQTVFEAAVMDGDSRPLNSAWLAPDPGAMRASVAENPAALGFLPRSWLDDSVKPLLVSGLPVERMRHPVLALSKSEPTGPEKAWLLCLQQSGG